MAVDLFESLLSIAAELEREGVDHALVGGLAVAVYGAPRATTDIDLLIQPGDIDRAVACARRAGFTFEALPVEFSDGMRLHRITRIEEGQTLTLDFILADAKLEPVWRSRVQYETKEGRRLWVIGREQLIAMKVQAGRAKDLADIERLQELDR